MRLGLRGGCAPRGLHYADQVWAILTFSADGSTVIDVIYL